MDKLVNYDPETILTNCKTILRDNRQLPLNCPSKGCLSLAKIELRVHNGTTLINIEANPPQIPGSKRGLFWKRNPICDKHCGITGNPLKEFFIEQNPNGNIVRAEADWGRNRIY